MVAATRSVGDLVDDRYEQRATRQVPAKAVWRARAVVAYAAVCGAVLLVLIAHYPSVGWVLLPWLIAFGWSVGQARKAGR